MIRQYLSNGHQVVLAGDGDSILLLKRYFPDLRIIDFPALQLRYTQNKNQRGFYLRALPTLIRFILADHYALQDLLNRETFDLVISDNRFGLFSKAVKCVYITHQLYVQLPNRLKWLSPIARALHACIYKRYNEVWVPDYASKSQNLSGKLSHGGPFDHKAKYIGPLSRFTDFNDTSKPNITYNDIAVLSGLEPQRSIFEKEIIRQALIHKEPTLIVQGKIQQPPTSIKRANITIVPHFNDNELVSAMQHAQHIIARSGYSTIMDLDALGLLKKAQLHPTPGQSEQEYLAQHIVNYYG